MPSARRSSAPTARAAEPARTRSGVTERGSGASGVGGATVHPWSSAASPRCRRTSSRSSTASRWPPGATVPTSSTSGFGNPDLPSPDDRGREARARRRTTSATTATRRRGASRSCARPRPSYYQHRFGVDLDPETEVIIDDRRQGGLQPPDVGAARARATRRSCRSPSYPIHIFGPLFAGANVREIPLGTGDEFFDNMVEAWEYSHPKPRVIVLSFPHNPTTTCVDLAFMQRVVDFAREKEVVARPRQRLRGPRLRRLPAAVDPAGRGRQGGRGRAVLDDEVVLDGRLARGVHARQPRGHRGARQAQELPRLRHVPADPDRRDRHA